MQATISTDAVLDAYVECALWSSTIDQDDPEHGGEPMDSHYDPDDISPQAMLIIRREVEAFLADESHADALAFWAETLGDEQIGHDFWLTRNRHGAGFWDRFYGSNEGPRFGRILTEAAHAYGEQYLYASGDKLYVS